MIIIEKIDEDIEGMNRTAIMIVMMMMAASLMIILHVKQLKLKVEILIKFVILYQIKNIFFCRRNSCSSTAKNIKSQCCIWPTRNHCQGKKKQFVFLEFKIILKNLCIIASSNKFGICKKIRRTSKKNHCSGGF